MIKITITIQELENPGKNDFEKNIYEGQEDIVSEKICIIKDPSLKTMDELTKLIQNHENPQM